MSRGKPRKLIRLDQLLSLNERVEMGVPLARAIRDLNLDVSRPLAAKHVKWYNSREFAKGFAAELLVASLDAPWLNPEGDTVQEQPPGWDYEGYFPFGTWVEKSE